MTHTASSANKTRGDLAIAMDVLNAVLSSEGMLIVGEKVNTEGWDEWCWGKQVLK
jgi:hypothetical protein